MKGGKPSQGFTIIETLIVLAVTSAMFIMAVTYISGKQNKVMFTDAIQDVKSRIQQVINETSSSYYPSLGTIACSAQPGGDVLITKDESATTTQGNSLGCVFLGRAILFGVDGDGEKYRIETIVGNRLDTNKAETLNLSAAKAQALYKIDTDGSIIDGGDQGMLKNGLSIVWMREGASRNVIGVASTITPDGQLSYDGSNLGSGAIAPNLIAIPHQNSAPTVPGVSIKDGVKYIADALNNRIPVTTNNSDGVNLCFASGTTNQSGLITIGSAGRTLSVEMTIKSGNKKCD